MKLRYVTAGSGVPIVLLHTLRTQLDMFQKVIPALAERFRVYALDYPGHGYSDIPDRSIRPSCSCRQWPAFWRPSESEMPSLWGSRSAARSGYSSQRGTTRWCAQSSPSIRTTINAGRGLRRSSALANVLFGLNDVPIVGGTVTRLRSFPIAKRVFEGGVVRKGSLPPQLAREMYRVGNRKGHYVALMSLVRHWPEWEQARREYGAIQRPVLLLYGAEDWSREAERESNHRAIPGSRVRVIPDAGHFFALDDPEELIRSIREFTDLLREPATAVKP